MRGRKTVVTSALFPGYTFIAIELQWNAARYCPGVAALLMDGLVPARVPDQKIAALQAQERDGSPDRLHRSLCRHVRAGARQGAAVSGLPPSDRCVDQRRRGGIADQRFSFCPSTIRATRIRHRAAPPALVCRRVAANGFLALASAHGRAAWTECQVR